MVIFAGGTGNPYFSTDTAAVLRAMEIGAQVILKGTKVEGVFDRGSDEGSQRRRYDELTFFQVIERGLKVMDSTAVTLCMDNNLPIIVFNIKDKANIKRIILGEKVGTLVAKPR